MGIQAVFFDMGGTIETFGYTRELRLRATSMIQKRLLDAGIDLHQTNEQLFETITSGLGRYKRWSISTMEELPPLSVWSEHVFEGLDVNPRSLEPIAEELTYLIETRFYQRAMRPEIPSVLEAIKQMGLKIGLISNVNSRGQVHTNLEAYGIIHYFDPIILSSVYGRRKPDPSIFHYAARMAKVPTSQCLYVGDRIARDILGARRAGYAQAIQIQHDFMHGEEDNGATPDAVITCMTELVELIKVDLPQVKPVINSTSGAIRAYLFDAGDVLYYRPERGKKLAAFLKELDLEVTDNHLIQKEVLASQAFRGEMTQDQYRERLLRLYGVTTSQQIERGKQILCKEDNDIRFFEGVATTLIRLKQQGYLLGIITDTAHPVHVKLEWFEKGGFGDVWDTIISSNEVGVRKPHPDIYQAALQQLGITSGQAVFVGHKASELEGARAVGMHTIAFNYDAEARADDYITNFSDLLKLRLAGEPTNMKWSLSTMWAIGRYPHLGEFINEALRLGFDQVELNHQVNLKMLDGIDLKHAPVSSIHEPCPAEIPVEVLKARDWMISSGDEESRRQGVEAVKRSIEMAGSIGVKHLVVHAGNVCVDWPREKELYNLFKAGQAHTAHYHDLKTSLVRERAALAGPRLKAVQKSLEELIEVARYFGVCLGLENRYHYLDIPIPDEMELLLSLAGPEVLGFWYDVGHAQTLDRLGFFPHQDWLDRFTNRMIGAHLHDVVGINDHQAPGQGEMDFLHILSSLPPEVILTLEINPEQSPDQIHTSLLNLTQIWRQQKAYETV